MLQNTIINILDFLSEQNKQISIPVYTRDD